MQISSLYIKNFRAIREISIDFFSITSLIGANNSGKSTIFKALDLFFDAGARVQIDDFHRKNVDDPIEIRVIFMNLTEEEVDEFRSALIDGKLSISREFTVQDSVSPNYSVFAQTFPPFSDVRAALSASEKLNIYRRIATELELPNVRSSGDVDVALTAWEEAHPDRLELSSIRGFFGATNVANGKIKKKTSLRLIPAVRDSAEEARTGKRSAVLELLADIARQSFENRKELQDFISDTRGRLAELTDPDTIPELNKISEDISDIVKYYYSDSSVVADWEVTDSFKVNFPTPKITVKNSDITTDIEFVGHGLQRVILFSLIQYMAQRNSLSGEGEREFDDARSDIILLIEEPEIYQHPIKQTVLYRNFGRIVQSFNRSNGIRFQLIFTTHSEKFVTMRDFEICRIVHKRIDASNKTQNSVGFVRLSKCIEDFASFNEPPISPMEEEAFAAKLHVFSREICEGFFADKVVLVEGATDKPVLEAYFDSIGRDNHLEGIQIIPVGGKSVMQKPAYIFRKVGIPTYLIFDNDDKKQGSNRLDGIAQNRFLQRIVEVGDPDDMPSGIGAGYYAYSGDLEAYVRTVIGEASYDQQFNSLSTAWGLPVKDIKKTPAAFVSIIKFGIAGGYQFEELEKIVAAIDAI